MNALYKRYKQQYWKISPHLSQSERTRQGLVRRVRGNLYVTVDAGGIKGHVFSKCVSLAMCIISIQYRHVEKKDVASSKRYSCRREKMNSWQRHFWYGYINLNLLFFFLIRIIHYILYMHTPREINDIYTIKFDKRINVKVKNMRK